MLVLLAPVNVVLELDADLPFRRLVPNEWVLEQLLRIGPLVIVLDEDRFDEALELFGPFLGLETGRWVARDEEEGPHGMHVTERRLRFRHLESRDAQAPQIGAVVISSLGIVLASNHFRSHPIGRPDERVAPPYRPVQLGTYTKIHCHCKLHNSYNT